VADGTSRPARETSLPALSNDTAPLAASASLPELADAGRSAGFFPSTKGESRYGLHGDELRAELMRRLKENNHPGSGIGKSTIQNPKGTPWANNQEYLMRTVKTLTLRPLHKEQHLAAPWKQGGAQPLSAPNGGRRLWPNPGLE
jgi:hypothetical protein